MPTDQTLAQRLAAHPRFRWLPGARDAAGYRVLSVDDDGVPVMSDGVRAPHRREKGLQHGPDLSDPATIGCLVGLLREAYDARLPVIARYAVDAVDQVGVDAEVALQNVGAGGAYFVEQAAIVLAAFVKAVIDGDGEAVALALLAAWGET